MKENMTEHEITTENLSRIWMQFKRRKDSLEAEKVGLHSRYIRGLTSIFDASKKRQISNNESF